MKRASLIGFCLLVVLALATPASAQVIKYLPTDLGTLGGSASSAFGVNDAKNVVGNSFISGDAALHAFMRTKKGMIDLNTLGGTNSTAYAINDANQVAGQADTTDNSSPSHAFLYTTAAGMQDLLTVGGSQSQANAINFDPLTQLATQIAGWSFTSGDAATHAVTWDANLNITDLNTLGGTNSIAFGNNCVQQVVGNSDTAGGTTDAFVWDSVNGMQDLGTLGGSFAQANAINCIGQIVGFSFLVGDAQADAFLITNGSMQDLSTLGGSFASANAINGPGTVVGSSNTTGDADVHAFVWTKKGGMQDLNNLIPANSGWDLNSANSINSSGKIVGVGTINGASHAFLLTPVH